MYESITLKSAQHKNCIILQVEITDNTTKIHKINALNVYSVAHRIPLSHRTRSHNIPIPRCDWFVCSWACVCMLFLHCNCMHGPWGPFRPACGDTLHKYRHSTREKQHCVRENAQNAAGDHSPNRVGASSTPPWHRTTALWRTADTVTPPQSHHDDDDGDGRRRRRQICAINATRREHASTDVIFEWDAVDGLSVGRAAIASASVGARRVFVCACVCMCR